VRLDVAMMEGLDLDYCISFQKKCKDRIVMEFCITLVRCNQIFIWSGKTFQNKTYINVFGM